MSQSFYNADNLVVTNGFVNNPNRYYLEEYFAQLPTLEAPVAVTQSTNLTTAVSSNSKYTIITTDTTSSTVESSGFVEFTFNNTLITANSIVVIQCLDNSDDNTGRPGLFFRVNNVALGSCSIRAVNHDSGTADANVYKIAVIVDPHVPANLNLCIADSTGASATTSVTDGSVSWNGTRGGINLATTGTDNDSVVLLPRTATSQELGANGNAPSAWTGISFGTENEVEWCCALSVADVSDVALWAGLKLTKTPVLATDADQAYFFFDADDSVVSTLTTNTTLHFGYSVGGTDYTTNLGITVTADRIYRLRIVIDKYRQVSVFVNELQYGLTTTAGTAGLTVTSNVQKSSQLTNSIDFIPYIGVQSTTGAPDTLTVYYEKISRRLD